jgi:hypothetical protein
MATSKTGTSSGVNLVARKDFAGFDVHGTTAVSTAAIQRSFRLGWKVVGVQIGVQNSHTSPLATPSDPGF